MEHFHAMQANFFAEATSEEISDVLQSLRHDNMLPSDWPTTDDELLIRLIDRQHLEHISLINYWFPPSLHRQPVFQPIHRTRRVRELYEKMKSFFCMPPMRPTYLTSDPVLFVTDDGKRRVGHRHVNGFFYDQFTNELCASNSNVMVKGSVPCVLYWEWLNDDERGKI